MTSLADKALAIAERELGVTAKNNDGPEIEKYRECVRLPHGSPWRVSFVCWVVRESGRETPGMLPEMKLYGDIERLVSMNADLMIALPMPGCVFARTEAPHACGFVTDVRDDGSIDTIESDSEKVSRRHRYRGFPKYFIRID